MPDFNPFDLATDPSGQQQNTSFNPFDLADDVVSKQGVKQSLATPNGAIPNLTKSDHSIIENIGNATINLPIVGAWPRNNTAQAIHASVAQAIKGVGEDIAVVVRQAGEKLGWTTEAATNKAKASYDSEREQYKKIPAIQKNPYISAGTEALTRGLIEGLPMAAGAKAIGMGGTLARNIMQDAAVAGGIGALQNRGDAAQRIQAGAISGAVGGALSAPFRALGAAGNAIQRTPEEMSAAEALFTKAGIKPTAGQLGGNESLQAVEAKLAGIPLVGGKGNLLEQQRALQGYQKEFVKGLQPPPGYAAKAMDMVRKEGDKMGPVDDTIAQQKLSALAKTIDGKISKTAVDKEALRIIGDIQTAGPRSFSDVWNFRQALDDNIFGSAGILKPSASGKNTLKEIRTIVESALERHADKAGLGEDWLQAKQLYQRELSFNVLNKYMDEAYDTLNTSTSGKAAVKFAQYMRKHANEILPKLDEDTRDAYRGVIKLTELMSANLKGVNPGINVMTSALTGGAALGAGAFVGPAAAGGLLITKAVTSLLNSAPGRTLLVKIPKMSAPEIKEIGSRVLQAAAAGITNKANTPAQQPQVGQ